MKIQWLGHSAFKITDETHGASVLIDPFLNYNPKFGGNYAETIAGVTHVLLTHGHNDHFGDTVDILKTTGAALVSTPELCGYVGSVLPGANLVGMNIGGTAKLGNINVSMVPAFHSSSYSTPDGQTIYGGMPTGLILHLGSRSVYHMGDTAPYSDMALIEEFYHPEIGIVPIGDHYTMGPEQAALAVNRWFNFKTVIPCHYATFPILEATADRFVAAVKKGQVIAPAPMQTVEL